MKKKRKIKSALESGIPREEIQAKFKRGPQLIESINKTPSENLRQVPQHYRESKKKYIVFKFLISSNFPENQQYGGYHEMA